MLALAACLFLIPGVLSYGSGAGPEACMDFTPRHGDPYGTTLIDLIQSDEFYELSVKETYYPGEILTVTLSKKVGAPDFKGFLIQARDSDSERVGSFTPGDDDRSRKVCDADGGITHTNANPKSTVTFQWRVLAAVGDIQFKATVVEEFDVVYSLTPVDVEETTPPAGATDPPTTTPRLPDIAPTQGMLAPTDTEACGKTAGCVRVPEDCAYEDCDQFFSWTKEGDSLEVDFSGKSSGWIAFGLSDDDRMGNDDVTECLYHDETVYVYESTNKGRTNEYNTQKTANLQSAFAEYRDGRIHCRFNRTYKPGDLDGEYQILLAQGSVDDAGFKIKHSEIPIATEAISLSDNMDITASVDNTMAKVHACLMLSAWMLCASLGILLARHYRNAWPGRQWFKKDLWFQLHRGLMVLTFCLHVAGFVVIFVDVEGWTEADDPDYLPAHAIMGVIVTALVLLNPILALFRCDPDSSARPIFDWTHFFIGNVALVMSVVIIFFGLEFPHAKTFAPCWLKWIVLAFAAFHIATQLILEVNRCVGRREEEEGTGDFMFRQPVKSNLVKDKTNGMLYVQYFILGLYVLVTLGLWLTMVVVIALEETCDE